MSEEGDQPLLESIGPRPQRLQIGDEIPNFTCDSHVGEIILHDYIDGSWGVILT